MNITTIQKWGNSYAVRLPKAVVCKLDLRAGLFVEIRETGGGRALSIIPVRRDTTSLAEMTSRITKKNQHSAVDWGDAIGKEAW